MEGPEEVETRFSYGRHVPPHPVLPLSYSLALRPLHPTVVFFFCSQSLKILCVLLFMSVAVMTLCSENCVLKHCCRDIYHSHLTTPWRGGGAALVFARFMTFLHALFIREAKWICCVKRVFILVAVFVWNCLKLSTNYLLLVVVIRRFSMKKWRFDFGLKVTLQRKYLLLTAVFSEINQHRILGLLLFLPPKTPKRIHRSKTN